MKTLSIVGVRPEFIQALPLSRVLRLNHQEIFVHTGQHYDYQMSQVFFEELDIPKPDYNLEVGSGTHGYQTAQILMALEQVILKEQPDLVIIRGDTNSTLAGALAASKLHIPSAHIEAGERSFDRRMPEEVNRLVADCLSDFHFCASEAAVGNLARENIIEGVYWVGDVMLDALLYMLPIARKTSKILVRLGVEPGKYSLVTVHRESNTENSERLTQIITALNMISETIVFPVHPRTRKVLQMIDIQIKDHIRLIDPVGYLDMVVLEENSRLIATDSGGVQREAYFMKKPCLTLRDETEWVATIEAGWNRLIGTNVQLIIDSWFDFSPPFEHPPIFGEGTAANKIVQILGQTKIHYGMFNSSINKSRATLPLAKTAPW